jgi:Predicted membrane protein (DUF2079)
MIGCPRHRSAKDPASPYRSRRRKRIRPQLEVTMVIRAVSEYASQRTHRSHAEDRRWCSSMKWLPDLTLAFCSAAFLVWIVFWQYSLYAAGFFGFHDLTIICDWFSNALVHGRPFWLTDGNKSHLAIHLTPSLILLTPVFALFQEQFTLIAVAASLVVLAIFVTSRNQHLILRQLGLPAFYSALLTASLFVVFATNRYTERIVSSAHFEPVFVLMSVLLLNSLRRDAGYTKLSILLLLALGIRQDTGLFLFCSLFSVVFAPRCWGRPSIRKIATLAAVCAVYVVLAAKLVMPWMGYGEGTRNWHEWGETWPQVFIAWLTSPSRVLASIGDSEFAAFNREFLYLPMLNPVAWLANQLPGVLFYTADATDKRYLDFYNASFLLPGMLLCFAFAQLHAVSFVLRWTSDKTAVRQVGLALVCLPFVYAAFAVATELPRSKAETIEVADLTRTDPFAQEPLRSILRCPGAHSVAADFRNIVYVPFLLDKYLLPRAAKADVVVIPQKFDRYLPYALKRKYILRDMSIAGRYEQIATVPGYDVFARENVDCRTERQHRNPLPVSQP